MLFWGQSEDPPTFVICGFTKEHMLKPVTGAADVESFEMILEEIK